MLKALLSATISLAIFATGASALVYQVAFERYLARLVGSDHIATGLTLAIFLGGLAIGYSLCGRLTLAVRDHLLVYAGLEALIGLWGALFPWLFTRVSQATSSWRFAYPWELLVQGLAVAAILVLPPTLLMGATVPFITRALARLREDVSSVHAAAYAINTAGSCVGVLLGGFYLVPAIGLAATVRAAALANVAAAVFFAILAAGFRKTTRAPSLAGMRRRPSIGQARFSPALVYTIGLLNGLSVLLLEGVTIRIGKLVLGSSTYTFSMIVAVFVLSIAAGSLIVSRLRSLPPGLLFGLQVVAGSYLLVLFTTIDEWPYYVHLLRLGFQAGTVGFILFHGAVLAALFAALAVPVAALGATLPVLFHELDASVTKAGWYSGRLLALNGIGTLAGSLGGGFVLYSVLDLPGVFLLVPAIVLANALLASLPLGRAAKLSSSALLIAAIAALGVRPAHDPDRLAFGLFLERSPLPFSFEGPDVFFDEYFRGVRVVARDDDPVAAVAVLERELRAEDSGKRSRMIVVNGRSDSDARADAETLKLAAHIPALWAASRERVLVIGLGTGVTAGELSLYGDVARIDVAEISPTVVSYLPLFSEFTGAVHQDPRLNVELGDALLTLRRGREPWDLITSEPSNPWVSGADQLFTREFYHLIRERLAANGLFVQWVQLYDSDFETLGILLNTLRSEFPVVHAFHGSTGDLLLLAATRPLTADDAQRARQTFADHARVAASLGEIGIESLREIVEREVRSLPVVMRQAERYGINTMDHPRLHYLAGKAMFSGTVVTDEMLRHGVTNLEFLFRHRTAPEHGDH